MYPISPAALYTQGIAVLAPVPKCEPRTLMVVVPFEDTPNRVVPDDEAMVRTGFVEPAEPCDISLELDVDVPTPNPVALVVVVVAPAIEM